jgi:hypothetical protein
MNEFWPYILPLPKKAPKQYQVLSSVFGSKVALEILKSTSPSKKVYQKDLINTLKSHSNKTVIENLKILVSAEVLEEGMEKAVTKGKVAWVKWYQPTFLGKWISLLILPSGRLPKEEVKGIIRELFNLYVQNSMKLCTTYGIDPILLKETFDEAFQSETFK